MFCHTHQYICEKCHGVVVNPSQATLCGHLYCRVCADIILREDNPFCIACGEEVTEETVFIDKAVKREMSAMMKCPDCNFMGDAWDTEAHYQEYHQICPIYASQHYSSVVCSHHAHSFICTLCHEVLENPSQATLCGHLWCTVCINNILNREEEPRCLCGTRVTPGSVFRDIAVAREMETDMNCPACNYHGNARNAEEHYRECHRNQPPPVSRQRVLITEGRKISF